jgi:S1-C subfamily serine protease
MSNVLTQLSDAISGVIAGAAPSIVRVDGARRSPSTGIAWSADLVVATAHAIRRDDGISVTRDDGESFAASLVGADGGTDVALLRVQNASLRPIRWSERETRTGDLLIVAGRPGRSVRATIGVASAVGGEWRTFDGSRIDRYIEVDAALPRGFSGGPLLDGDGGSVGMNTSRVTPGGTTVPHATLRRVIDELQQHGSVRRPLIGIGVYPVEDGLLVMSVKDGSSADRAGILVGDIIRTIDGKEVHSPRGLNAIIQSVAIDQEIEIGLRRGGDARTVRLKVGSV